MIALAGVATAAAQSPAVSEQPNGVAAQPGDLCAAAVAVGAASTSLHLAIAAGHSEDHTTFAYARELAEGFTRTARQLVSRLPAESITTDLTVAVDFLELRLRASATAWPPRESLSTSAIYWQGDGGVVEAARTLAFERGSFACH